MKYTVRRGVGGRLLQLTTEGRVDKIKLAAPTATILYRGIARVAQQV